MQTRGDGKSRTKKSKPDATYLHDFTGNDAWEKHRRIREALAAYKNARVVVSYYDCADIRELYEGWTFVDKSRQKNLHSQNGRGSRPLKAPEVLIINGPSYAKGD